MAAVHCSLVPYAAALPSVVHFLYDSSLLAFFALAFPFLKRHVLPFSCDVTCTVNDMNLISLTLCVAWYILFSLTGVPSPRRHQAPGLFISISAVFFYPRANSSPISLSIRITARQVLHWPIQPSYKSRDTYVLSPERGGYILSLLYLLLEAPDGPAKTTSFPKDTRQDSPRRSSLLRSVDSLEKHCSPDAVR